MTLKETYEKETGERWNRSLYGFSHPSRDYLKWLRQKAEEGQRAIRLINQIKQEMRYDQTDEDKLIKIQCLLVQFDYQKKEG